MKYLGEMGEDALIERLIQLVPLGRNAEAPGDDCAVLAAKGEFLQLLKTDSLVEGVHFLCDADPRAVGWKAIARVISDFAAMGGKGRYFLVSIAMPSHWEISWLEEFYRGMGDCLLKHDCLLVGGETCRVPLGSSAVLTISATGYVSQENCVSRSGAKAGDEIWVTGRLGGSLSGKHLSFTPRVKEAEWIVPFLKPTAMMDLSDGLAKDLPRLAKASACGFHLDRAAIPCNEACTIDQALGDGEDFELLFTLPAGTDTSMWASRFPKLELTKIGCMVEVSEGEILKGGWDHFS